MASGVAFILILLYTTLFFIRPQDYIAGLSEWSPLVICLWTAVLFWILVPKKRFVLPQFLLLVGLAFSIFMSLLLFGWTGGAFKLTADFFQVIAYFALLVHVVDSVKRFKIFFGLVIACALVYVLHGYVQITNGIAWTGVSPVANRIRYVGAFNDPNDLGMAFAVAFGLSTYFYRKQAGFFSKLVGFTVAGIILYGVFLTNSRGTFLSVAAVIFLIGYLKYGRIAAILLGPVIIALMLAVAPSRMDTIDDDSSRERVEAWFEGWQMFKSHPFFGVGRDQFKDFNHITAHNSFVLAYSEIGFIGYFFWFALFLVSAAQLYHCLKIIRLKLKSAKDDDLKTLKNFQSLGLSIMYAYIGALVCIFFLSRSYATITYMLLGLIGAYYHFILKNIPETKVIYLRSYWRTCFFASASSIVFFVILTKILLILQ